MDRMDAPEPTADAARARVAGLAAALAVVGGLGHLATLLVHGDLPDATTEASLEHIANRPEWPWLKASLMATAFCWIGAIVALVRTFRRPTGGLLGRLAIVAAVAGFAVVAVEYAIIGHAVKRVADAWRAAEAVEAAAQAGKADVLLTISWGLFHTWVALLYGLTFALLGLAVSLDPEYPRRLGWIAVVCGTGALVAGVTRYVGLAIVPYPVLFGGFVFPLMVWLPAIAIWARRRRG